MASNLYSSEVRYQVQLEVLAWVNEVLELEYSKIEDMCTRAAYCQITDKLFPKSVLLSLAKPETSLEPEVIHHFKMLQAAFKKMSVDKIIPIKNLVKGQFLDSVEVLLWFKKFFDDNSNGGDDTQKQLNSLLTQFWMERDFLHFKINIMQNICKESKKMGTTPNFNRIWGLEDDLSLCQSIESIISQIENLPPMAKKPKLEEQ